MIRKTKKGYVVYSEDGKRLSKPYQIREQAMKDCVKSNILSIKRKEVVWKLLPNIKWNGTLKPLDLTRVDSIALHHMAHRQRTFTKLIAGIKRMAGLALGMVFRYERR